MRSPLSTLALTAALLAALSGCTASAPQTGTAAPSSQAPASSGTAAGTGETAAPPSPSPSAEAPAGTASTEGTSIPPSETEGGQIDGQEALAIALDNAGVPESDAYNVKVERDGDNGVPIYGIEFETDYGDYDFEVAIDGGQIVGADYEVDEEYLDSLTASPISLEDAAALVQEKVPGAPAEDVRVWEEGDDGRTRYEGELFYGGLKYEFEIDPQTGRIFDWNADLRG